MLDLIIKLSNYMNLRALYVYNIYNVSYMNVYVYIYIYTYIHIYKL